VESAIVPFPAGGSTDVLGRLGQRQPFLVENRPGATGNIGRNEPLRAVVNSGWTRGSGVLRCDGDNSDLRPRKALQTATTLKRYNACGTGTS
jgi:hypothetical protein